MPTSPQVSGLVGFLIPLALFYLLSHFSRDKIGAVLGTIAAVCLLLIMRDTVHTFVSYAFPRVFQGKTFLLAAGIPLFAAASLDYFKFRDMNSWLFLFLVSTALIGTTNSAGIIIPSLAVLLYIAFFFIAENRQKFWKIFIPFERSLRDSKRVLRF